MIIDFDKVLERVGEFKRYQISHYVLLGIASVPVGMHTLANVFIAATPNHWCTEPQVGTGIRLYTPFNTFLIISKNS